MWVTHKQVESAAVPRLFIPSKSCPSSKRSSTNFICVGIRPTPAQEKCLKETVVDPGLFCLTTTPLSLRWKCANHVFYLPFLNDGSMAWAHDPAGLIKVRYVQTWKRNCCPSLEMLSSKNHVSLERLVITFPFTRRAPA